MKPSRLGLALGSGSFAFVLLLSATQTSVAADRGTRLMRVDLPASIAVQRLPQPLSAEATELGILHHQLRGARGEQLVIVRLRAEPVAKLHGREARAQAAHKFMVKAEQNAFIGRSMKVAPALKVVGSVQTVLNAVFVEADAADLSELAKDPAVARIAPVGIYHMDLSETVPYIGAAAVQARGFDGSGVRVAVLDSGIDYTHAALGGSGDPADYAGNNPNIIEPGTFPTAKVVGGFDFVGGLWPGTATMPQPLMPDPDPLDDGPGAGHGTHVSDIIGGATGVAPGVDLYAVKVCSSVSTACSGVALINGMEFAVDNDVDVINMSLGSPYGQPFDDDLSAAVDNATAAGVLTVASAGNSADKPYATGTPSAAATALAVAQTQVPSAALQNITVDGVNYRAEFQPWSTPLVSTITGPVQYGDGAGGNLNGCAPFAAGSLTGKIVLVDRGVCNFTLKISNIGVAGGSAGIIGLIAPGAPFAGGDGGDRPIDIPGYMISQADSNALKAQIGGPGIGTIDPSNQVPLVMQMVGSSSRGPSNENPTLLKPEIGAPGASVSAIAGTGTGTGPFGGTSGAAPMVSGSAALLLQAHPLLSPLEVKARLMNTGETAIDTDPFTGLAPITRIGGGEVRVDRALDAAAAAWQTGGTAGGLSFGFVDVHNETVNLKRRVTVRNFSSSHAVYEITPSFRFGDDAATGAVEVKTPKRISVPAGGDATFNVKLKITGANLPGNFMNSGSQGANGSALTLNEFDGYITLHNGAQPIHLPWQVLPRKAADVVGGRGPLVFDEDGIAVVELENRGVGTAQNDAYSLLARSPNLPEGGLGQQSPTPDIRFVGINTFPVPAGFCSSAPSFVWVFAITSWERQEHVLPVVYIIGLDFDQDGEDDAIVLNSDLSGGALNGQISDGRNVTFAAGPTGPFTAFFFAEHATNTANTALIICAEQIGLSGADLLTNTIDMNVTAFDFYYGGPGDFVDGITVTPFGERFVGFPEDIPGKSSGGMTVVDFGAFPGNTPELGVLLFTNGDRGTGARGGTRRNTEARIFRAR